MKKIGPITILILVMTVWLGVNVTVLKGVTIGDNSVIGNGALVVTSLPENVVAGGIPAKVIKAI